MKTSFCRLATLSLLILWTTSGVLCIQSNTDHIEYYDDYYDDYEMSGDGEYYDEYGLKMATTTTTTKMTMMTRPSPVRFNYDATVASKLDLASTPKVFAFDNYNNNVDVGDKYDDAEYDGDDYDDEEKGFFDSPDLANPSVPDDVILPNEASTVKQVSYQSTHSKLLAIVSKPGILAGIVGGAIIGILTAVLLIMFIVYRMRKKDEGSYALEETKKPLSAYDYRHCPTKEFYA